MSDMITAEEAQKKLEEWADGPAYKHRDSYASAAPDLARTVIALHAQLADAKAAQAMVVERAADAVLPENDPGVWRGSWFEPALREAQARIRALADADGLAMVQELRTERDGARKANREMALEVLASSGQAQEAYEAQLKAEADRDRIAAEKAELEARVEKLVGALRAADDFLDKGLDQMARNVTRAALSKLTPTPSDTDGPIWHERLGWDGNKEGK